MREITAGSKTGVDIEGLWFLRELYIALGMS